MDRPLSDALMAKNSTRIPGGVVSLNRKVVPNVAFVRGEGAYLWDADGNRVIDFHAAFGPYLLGHGHLAVEKAVQRAIQDGWTLTGAGTTPWEGHAAELLCQCVPTVERVEFTNTGSEATYLALRLARAHTRRDHVIVMQGGYNGWHDYVAYNVMSPLDQVGPRDAFGEYPKVPLTAGIGAAVPASIHVVEFNSLEAVRNVMRSVPVAAVITEPILQNIGVVKPKAGYLEGLRNLCDEFGSVLILDEVKTGFRHALGGYHSLAGVTPDLVVFGKAIANGYPVGALAGKASIMDRIIDPDPAQRVMIAGTYNGHPVPMAATIATLQTLRDDPTLYWQLEALGARAEQGLNAIGRKAGIPLTVSRQGSAFAPYFMDREPESWHDLAEHHDMDLDTRLRQALVDEGIFFFPLPTKQCSISTAHTAADIDEMLEAYERVLAKV